MLADERRYTPTPVISHAILTYNRGRSSGLADGIVITPSHNPPEDGGFKYNPPNGGPADTDVTGWIEERANELLEGGLRGVQRMPYERALTPLPRIGTTISSLCGRSGQRDRYGSDPQRAHQHGRGSAGRRGSALLGADRGALRLRSHRCERDGGPDLPLHDASIGTARSAWIARRLMRCSG